MKNILFSVLLAASLVAQESILSIIPQPVEMKQGTGSLTISSSASVRYNSDKIRNAAELFAHKISVPTGFSLSAEKGAEGTILFFLNTQPNKKLGNEGYTLDVSETTARIAANTQAGIFYGMQTLLQLLPKEIERQNVSQTEWKIPSVSIVDYPRFPWRGIMLDVSRHFFPKEDVKKYIDELSRYKFNTFHWHLTDDNGWRIEITSLPKLTAVGAWRVERFGNFGRRDDPKPGEPATYGGFYTQNDIREIVAYAQERNITIVPEIDLPGHSMAAIAAYPELSCTKDTSTKVNPGTHFADWYGNGTFKMLIENALNPSDEKVYEFIDKVFTEVAALFPSPYIHVGGDECYKGYWQRDPGCRALMKKLNIRHVEDLQGYFMNRVEKIVNAKGKKLLGWDEILEGGIAPTATVMSWRGLTAGIEASSQGHDVVMTPTSYAYIDYNQGDQTVDPPLYASLRVNKCYSFEPVPDGADARHILGGQGNLWTEQVPNLRAAEYMSFPRAWALSEVFWSPKDAKDWDNFSNRMERHFERADAADINYSRAAYDAIVKTSLVNGALMLMLESELSGIQIYFTIDDTMPDDHSPRYTAPVQLPNGPITLRVITYRNGNPIGHLITLQREMLEQRAGR